jgi:PAS domain S-box-containing protein
MDAAPAPVDLEPFYRAVLDGLADELAVVDETGVILATNAVWRSFAARHGGHRGCAEGANYLEVCDRAAGESSEEAAAFAAGLRSVLSGDRQLFHLEYPCHDAREQRWFAVRVSPLPGPGPRRAVIAHQDVTARHLQEQELHRAQARLAAALGAGGIGTWVWNIQEGTAWSDEAARRLFARTPEELGGVGPDRLLPFIHPDDRQRVLAALEEVGALGRPPDLEFRYRQPGGEWVAILAKGLLERDEQGRPLRITGACVDVTERRRIEARLLEAQKMEAIGRLSGGVAHDFNNLLTVILGNAELLAAALPAGGGEVDLLREIRDASERAADLTRQLLAFSRSQVMAPRIVSLNDAVASMEPMLRRILGPEVVLETALSPAAGEVRVDPLQLEQVVANLAVNARDAMPRGGRLLLETQPVEIGREARSEPAGIPPGRYEVLAIRDSGVGMTAEMRARIFEPFYTSKSLAKGSGLGLSSVLGIVEQSGGAIDVETEVGAGSCFRIYLPSAAGAEIASRAGAEPCRAAPETILMVEDEDGVRNVARRALESRGYRVLVAADGREARALAEDAAPAIDLLITDLVMPGMGGHELANLLRASRPGLRVLFISGYVDDQLVRRDLEEEGTAFLAKPFSLDQLAARVRAVLDAPPAAAADAT